MLHSHHRSNLDREMNHRLLLEKGAIDEFTLQPGSIRISGRKGAFTNDVIRSRGWGGLAPDDDR